MATHLSRSFAWLLPSLWPTSAIWADKAAGWKWVASRWSISRFTHKWRDLRHDSSIVIIIFCKGLESNQASLYPGNLPSHYVFYSTNLALWSITRKKSNSNNDIIESCCHWTFSAFHLLTGLELERLRLQKNRNYNYLAILGTVRRNLLQFRPNVIYFFDYF